MADLSTEDFATTAEDLAQSFLDSQSRAEQRQLMSLYAEAPMAASVMSSTTTASEEDDDEIGVGTAVGLPTILANMFKGIADRMVVRIRGVHVSVEANLPEDRGGERVLLEFEIKDVDVEGVSRNVTAATPSEPHQKPRKEGKRRITLENIRGYVTAAESMFGVDPETAAESAVFGSTSEAPFETGYTAGDGTDEIYHAVIAESRRIDLGFLEKDTGRVDVRIDGGANARTSSSESSKSANLSPSESKLPRTSKPSLSPLSECSDVRLWRNEDDRTGE